MGESDYIALGNEVRAVFAQYKPMSFACVVGKAAYQEWRRKQTTHHAKDGTFYALDLCLTLLIHRINQSPADDGIDITCDQGDGREKTATDIADWRTDQLRENAWRFPGHPDPNRTVTFGFASSRDIMQLQAADVVVHTMLKWSEAHLKGEDADAVPFFQEMQSMLSLHPLFTLDDIEFFRRITLQSEQRHRENMAMKPVP